MEDRPEEAGSLLERIGLARFGRLVWARLRQAAVRKAPGEEAEAQRETEEAIAHWVSLLADPEAPGHREAVDVLVGIGRPALPALVQALQSESWLQAFRACEALAAIGDRRAVGPLMRALSHPNSNVRWAAAEALGQLRSRWARGRLRRVARNDETRTSWGEPVAEAAERAIERIDRTPLSLFLSTLEMLLLIGLCGAIVWGAFVFIRQELRQLPRQRTPTPTVTPTATSTPTPTPTPTPLPEFPPIRAVVVAPLANVRDRPDTATGAIIGVLHETDEVWIHGGRMGAEGKWWYAVTLAEIHNPQSSESAGLLQQGARGWIFSELLAGVETLQVAPTVEAIETMRAAAATPTPLETPLPIPTVPSSPTP
jgi:hypothetical protein